jgi:hypothetical protein
MGWNNASLTKQSTPACPRKLARFFNGTFHHFSTEFRMDSSECILLFYTLETITSL